ncbi:hypothetical protein Franean1_3596 [Parafrankia sp. EAN1pec]|nr:hypothetical protein Franean1_3596 [Frankia sp. EAN1pec]
MSPADFNTQLGDWLGRANARTVRAVQGRPVDLLATDYRAVLPLGPVDPPVRLNHRIPPRPRLLRAPGHR